MSKYTILFFTSGPNRSTTLEYINTLDDITKTKVQRMLEALKSMGPEIRPPHSKQVEKNLYELRVRGKVEVRIFYSFEKSSIWIWHAFSKKTMKLPAKEIKLANLRKDFQLS